MQFVSFEQFITNPKHGYIYFFSIGDSCGACKQCEIALEQNNVPRVIKVNPESEDDLMSIGIPAVPCVRVYDMEDKVSRQWFGVLYDKQIRELLEHYGSV